MQTTGEFTIHKFEIEFENYNEPIYLFPFGDVHRTAPNCDEERWLEFLDWAKHKKRAYFLGMGDYLDLASTSERVILGNKNLHDSTLTTLDGHYEVETIRFWNEIKFMQDRIIGLVEGNHYGEFQSGITTTQYLAQKMKCKYLGVCSFIRLIIKQKGAHRGYNSLDICVHHGKGASTMVGGSLNRVEKMLFGFDADIYLMGHDHKKSCSYVPTMHLSRGGGKALRLHQKKKLIARTGSFLKGYVDGKKSYVADGAMNPTDLGTIKIELTPKRKQFNGKQEQYIDIHTSI
jgi:predicted phosphodiesterase